MASLEKQSIFAKVATSVDSFFARTFLKIGRFVGTRPCTSLLLSMLLMLACSAGFSQVNSESRADKLWIPQGTRAQADEAEYKAVFPPGSRFTSVLIEAKTGSALDKAALQAAMELHRKLEDVKYEGTTFTDVCIPQPGMGYPCFIMSVLSVWGYNTSTLAADADPLATLNSAGMSEDNLRRMLGTPTFSGGELTGAKSVSISYFMRLNQTLEGGAYVDKTGDGFEEEMLKVLGCDAPSCSGDTCACGYDSDKITVYAQATRSFGDVFGGVIQGDIGLINGAFMLMIIYLILNLGGLCHKVNSRAGLAFLCVLTIVASGAAGYGLGMWCQFDYTPVHSVLPFVIIGIGVDYSFVIINALDRTDPTKDVSERIAVALSHAGVSITVTSITDFVAFAISVSSALPALSAFCMYAAWCVLMLLIFQVTMFSALAVFDLRRVVANRIDCCFCLPRGFICCPTVPKEDAQRAIDEGKKDPNQMCCCPAPKHSGGRVGHVLEKGVAPQLIKWPVAAAVIAIFSGFCGLCAWQANQLAVQDTERKFLPDDSYLLTTLEKNDEYFASVGTRIDVMTIAGDYFASQRSLVAVGHALDEGVEDMLPTSTDSYRNWALSFRDACKAGMVNLTKDGEGYAIVQTEYYAQLHQWTKTMGGRFAGDIVWVDATDPQKGIRATKIGAELRSVKKVVGGQTTPDADRAVAAMDGMREVCDAQATLPGGKCIPFAREFLTWETFKIIRHEMFVSTGLCLAAVLVITLALIAHPLTAGLVFICVLMTIVDILGCMHMWGLAIDSVSVIQLVIAVGLSVDYSAHVGHNFMIQTGTRKERVVKTLGDVGAAVLCGAISTFLGVMLLVLSKSYVFRVLFQTFFLTVVLGVAHGLILLPALLSLIGPASYKTAPAEADKGEAVP